MVASRALPTGRRLNQTTQDVPSGDSARQELTRADRVRRCGPGASRSCGMDATVPSGPSARSDAWRTARPGSPTGDRFVARRSRTRDR